MKRTFNRIAEFFFLGALVALNLCATCWAGPPAPPTGIPATPVGNVEVTALTVLAVAGYGYWKGRR